ncbi:hypothetical protein [Ralstonia syzygii]|uniref:hypothetical protein n=1 Tax=Ralstonia solanacearum species complex TaxID=3116862 RepID=UPI000E9422C1|nr:hypothetical protein CJO76_23495 [Ralstonia solanacearum]AXV93857.1 hypothetical protein CJO79_23475 [Ralstonia solanacearum]AXW21848.1 hypothetical protein CJO85_23600 [Ralstonia solanacearum]AXW78751.1 hypothetical protein CJO97_23480 [Ralstonia solanacearum]BEU75049.1 hypothetical protein MAFF211271_46040 [Ralstonia pseudosolanacearum]
MAQARPPFHITIPIDAGFDLLDVAAPVELFSWMAEEGIGTQTTATVGSVFLRSIPCSTTATASRQTLGQVNAWSAAALTLNARIPCLVEGSS